MEARITLKGELKLKNAVYPILCMAFVITIYILVICLVAIFLPLLLDNDSKYMLLILIIGISIIIGIWVIALISLPFCKTIIITQDSIKTYRFKREIDEFLKEDMIECIYTPAAWYMYIFGLTSFGMFDFLIKLKDVGISQKYLMLSYKQVKKIQDSFDYPIRIISSIHEQ